ncbi:MAG: hypothetical protein J2P13_05520 [Acidobacteria bacterium]|nr:hypothetical protein [Acidobacteriota bacterium]
MVRISIIETASKRTLLVEGKLALPWTCELEKAWSNASHDLHGRNLAIDLRNVTVISPEGENTLLELIKRGAKFTCRGVLNKHILKQLARRSGGRLRDMLLSEGGSNKI